MSDNRWAPVIDLLLYVRIIDRFTPFGNYDFFHAARAAATSLTTSRLDE